MFTPIPENILNLIRKHKRAVVCGHVNPDGDCANSVLAIGHLLKILGKEYLLINDGSFTHPEIIDFSKSLTESVSEEWLNKDTLGIVVDCSSEDRLGTKAPLFKHFTTVIFDHHATSVPFAKDAYIIPASPSATLLIYRLYKELDITIDKEAASFIFRGFSTDSGFFRFLGSGTEEVFEIVADLVSQGVNPSEEYGKLNSGRSFLSVKYLSCLIDRVESYYDGRLLISHEDPSDLTLFGEEGHNSDSLYRELLSVKGVEVVSFFKISNKIDNAIEVGLRVSYNSDVDVGEFAGLNGGGGHKKAAGFTMKGSYEDIKKLVIEQFGKIFAN